MVCSHGRGSTKKLGNFMFDFDMECIESSSVAIDSTSKEE